MAVVEYANVGPVEHKLVTVPEAGGVVVFTGPNGSGKTSLVEATEAMLRGERGKVSTRDGAKCAEVIGYGVQMRVGRSSKRSGVLEVSSLEGRFDVGDLVDPGIDDGLRADARRIKAIAQLTGGKADPTLFWDLLNGREEFEALVGPDAIETDDLVDMAGRIKRAIEKHARGKADEAERMLTQAQACRSLAGGVNIDEPDDTEILQAALEAAIAADAKLKAEAEAFKSAADAAQEAQERLEEAEASYTGPGVDVARAEHDQALEKLEEAINLVVELEMQLESAKAARNLVGQQAKTTEATWRAAENHERMIAGWQETISRSDGLVMPQAEELEAAAQRVATARTANEQGVLIRQAKAKLAESDDWTIKASDARRKSEQLRDAAHGTDDILTNVVAQLNTPLRVKDGRLVVSTNRGDATLFGDLSHGERWKIVLDLAIEAVGPRGVIPLKQEAWEGLDVFNRKLIADHLRGTGVVLFTAEASRDEDQTELSVQVIE